MSTEISPILNEEHAALSNGHVPQMPAAARSRRCCLPFSFIQASDFRLDTPCAGLTGLPTEVRERIVEARYLAAERVFDAAIEHAVDCVVLSGGLLDARLPGLRGPSFLVDQFRRLARHGIDVYWSGASLETRGRWPAALELPTNVHRLRPDATGILHGRNGQPVARLLTLPTETAQLPCASETFTIAVQPHCSGVPDLLTGLVDFWALGGQAHCETLQVGEVIAHFSGSPQGRGPLEVGRHSCSLVKVDEWGTVCIEPRFTDVVRWHQLRLTIDEAASWPNLESQLAEQHAALRSENGAVLHLVHWTVQGNGTALEKLLHPRHRADLTSRLNRQRQQSEAMVWTTAIEPVVETHHHELWRALKTPLGAYVRELDEMTPQLDGMFGLCAGGPHPLGAMDDQSRSQLVEQAIHEGLFWFGSEPQSLRTAG